MSFAYRKGFYRMEKENKKVKNSVLIDLFYEDESARENQIALYNALHEEKLPGDTQVKLIRVENVLYMNFQNDFSYEADEKILVIGEHQATINQNMPLRSLMYIGRIYEQLIPVRDRYKKSMVRLPKPEFYTFYNGKESMEKEQILRLSDAFKVQDGQFMLDLQVKVININPDAEHEVLERCPVMKEYSLFIETIRKYQDAGDENAYEMAIKECIERGILAEYLKKKGSEVINMLKAEYDYEMDIEVQREEAYEEGKAEGKEEANLKAICNMIRFGVPEQEILTEYTKEELEKAKKLGSDSLYGQTV